MSPALTLDVRNDTAELGRVAVELARFGAAHGLDEQDVFETTLALDEVLTNVIWYAFGDGEAHEIAVRVELVEDELAIEVEDDGVAFDPLGVKPLDRELGSPVQERPVGGLGMHFVRRTMHALAYRREMGKNILMMRRRVAQRR